MELQLQALGLRSSQCELGEDAELLGPPQRREPPIDIGNIEVRQRALEFAEYLRVATVEVLVTLDQSGQEVPNLIRPFAAARFG